MVLSVIELMTKFVGVSSFDIEFPSSSLVEFLHPKNARHNTDAARIAAALEKCWRFYFHRKWRSAPST